MASLKQCTRCRLEHEPPVGKKCKRPLQALPAAPAVETSSVPEEVVEQATGGYDDHLGSLVSVISQLVTRLDSQQEQLNLLQMAVASTTPVVSHSSPAEVGQGAILKRSCTQEALLVDNVTLPDLRADRASMSQAIRMVDSLDLGLQGNTTSMSFPKTLKWGWARPGGDNAPRIPIPWPQDFIIGQGRKPRLLLSVRRTCLIEREEDLPTVRAMLAQLRATMQDTQFHGYEAACYAYGTILSLLEDGTVTWADSVYG
jgi:hypothetical protein